MIANDTSTNSNADIRLDSALLRGWRVPQFDRRKPGLLAAVFGNGGAPCNDHVRRRDSVHMEALWPNLSETIRSIPSWAIVDEDRRRTRLFPPPP